MTDQTTDVDTPYHSITKPAYEKDPWDHDYYELVDKVDTNLKLSGLIADRPDASNAPNDVWYEATDENLIYRNDSTNGWVVIGFGVSGNPVPGTSYFENIDATGTFEVDGVTVLGDGVSVQGNFNIENNQITRVGTIKAGTSSMNFYTEGNPVGIYDSTNGQYVLRANEGGNVDIPNGQVTEQGDNVLSSPDGDYEVQKNGTDGSGIINFKTN